jgi:hypothetical protein
MGRKEVMGERTEDYWGERNIGGVRLGDENRRSDKEEERR